MDVSDDAHWLLELLLRDDASPSWSHLSAFHALRTRPPEAHPGFGQALLLWQRAKARLGERAAHVATEALLALRRSGVPRSRLAARVLELWSRSVPLGVELLGRLAAVELLPADEAALLGEELALGAYEGGIPSSGVLQLVAHLPGMAAAEARALAQTERFLRGSCTEEAVAEALAPGLFAGEPAPLPALTSRLLGGLGHPLAWTPEAAGPLAPVLARIRSESCGLPDVHPAAELARRVVACSRALGAGDLFALLGPGRAAAAGPRLPAPPHEEVRVEAARHPATAARRFALHWPRLAGAVELGAALPGLTGAVERLTELLPSQVEGRVEAGELSALCEAAGLRLPTPSESTLQARLEVALRCGTPLALDELLALRPQQPGLTEVLFDSPRGPGRLTAEGKLDNGHSQWPAPTLLVPTHPLELVEAERWAWQARLVEARAPALLSQPFRECFRPSTRDRTRKRLDGHRGAAWSEDAFLLLRRRGWFPLLSPLEVPPELHLGSWRVRLVLEESHGRLLHDGLDFFEGTQPRRVVEVPARVFSEAVRDLDEALALFRHATTHAPRPERAELFRLLAPRFGLESLRVEDDHLAFGDDGRLSLGEGLGPGVTPGDDEDERSRAALLLPFVDDGGLAARLVGRLMALAPPETNSTP